MGWVYPGDGNVEEAMEPRGGWTKDREVTVNLNGDPVNNDEQTNG